MWRNILTLLLPMLLLLAGCVDPIKFEQEDQQEHLVVEASFSNLDSSYVRLSYSQPYSYPYNKFEDNASVFITSEEGEYVPFYLQASGLYKPDPTVAAVIGHTYQLHVQVGINSYESAKVKMLDPVPIDSVYTEFAEMEVGIWGQPEKELMPGYKYFVDYTDPAGEKNYYRWSVSSVIEVFTQPWDYVEYSCRGCPRPAPKDCCAHCWIYERSELYNVESDRLSNGTRNIHHELNFVPFERDLQAKHKMVVYQHAISEAAYNFYKVVEQQRQTSGTVFDPPPSQLKGNLYNVEDPDEQVIGYFDASSVSMKEIVIRREDIKEANVGEYVYPDDCLTIRNSTTRMPQNW